MAGKSMVLDGCRAHAISAADINHAWDRASELDAVVCFCTCCGGPAPVEFVAVEGGGSMGASDRCKWCELGA